MIDNQYTVTFTRYEGGWRAEARKTHDPNVEIFARVVDPETAFFAAESYSIESAVAMLGAQLARIVKR